MGSVAFEWGNKKLTLLQNRDNFDTLMVKAAAWDEAGEILSGRDPNGGTWFGISRHGRVAFLVDNNLYDASDRYGSLPIGFLEGQMSPKDFAIEIARNHSYNGMTFHLIVADILSNSMFYIYKNHPVTDIDTKPVGFGEHILSSLGLDFDRDMLKMHLRSLYCHMELTPPEEEEMVHLSALSLFDKIAEFKHTGLPPPTEILHLENFHLRYLFNMMLAEFNDILPPPKEMAERFMYDPHEAVEGNPMTAIFVDFEKDGRRYRTMSTTALIVRPSKEVNFYERYLENGEWKDHGLDFNIIG